VGDGAAATIVGATIAVVDLLRAGGAQKASLLEQFPTKPTLYFL
jgi:hypothetical protein